MSTVYARPQGHAIGELHSLHLAQVVDNEDPDNRGRVRVRLTSTESDMWASVVAPSAGHGYGASFVPRVDEIVVVAFASPELPLVLGSIWSGADSMPGDASPTEDRYTVHTPAGTVMVFDDANGPRLELRTPQGRRVSISDADGGEIAVECGTQSVRMDSSQVSIKAAGEVKVQAASVTVDAGQVQVNAGMAQFSGVVQCSTLITNAVVSSSYTPGAGNIW